METEIQLTYENFEKYVKTIQKRMNNSDRRMIGISIGIAIIAVFDLIQKMYALGILCLVAAVAMPFFMKRKLDKSILRAWNMSQDVQNKVTRLIFNEDCVEQINDLGTSSFRYDQFVGGFETENEYFLLSSPNQGIMVEKSKCSPELNAFIRNKIEEMFADEKNKGKK